MKMEEIPRSGLIALGVAGLAATALLGFAAGMIVARNPQALRSAARRVARDAAQGLEQVSLLAAQAREQMGDLWAEVREEARVDLDEADFARAATAAGATTVAAGDSSATESAAPPKRRRRPRRAGSTTAGSDESVQP